MIRLALAPRNGTPYRVLCLGAHSDDIEIGCGGTILRLMKEHHNLIVHWVVFSTDKRRAREARVAASRFLQGAEKKTVETNGFSDTLFPFEGREIKQQFIELRRRFSPDVVFTHTRHDLHQDHRVVSDLTWNTFRDHMILEYEIPKYDGDLGAPNVFVPLDEETCSRKMEYIVSTFKSQRDKHWFTEDTFRAIMRLRGMEANSPSKYAEAFYCRKLSI
jgi:LmbE family N-acetylglucosaminyl deacetylase